jgi:GGDEF domain-containing protein
LKLTPLLPRIRVERDILLVFALCALIPVGALALLSANSEAFLPIGGIRVTLPLAILLSLSLVSLLSIGRIHRRMLPLEKLQEGTRFIADDNLEARLNVTSGDEFEELATFVNTMAGRLSKQFESLSTIIEIDRVIHSSIDRKGIVNTVLARIRDIHPCDAVSVSLVRNDAEDVLETFVARGERQRCERTEGKGLTRHELRQLRAHPEHMWIDLDARAPGYLESLAAAGVRRSLVLPLALRHEVIGLIALGHRDPQAQVGDNVVYARQLADQVAIALGNARVLDENRVLAYYDSLTGLPNRRMYKERLGRTLDLSRRRKRLLATCYVDLDGFKRINESLGHGGGDRLLREVARRLTGCVRGSDAV